MTSWVYTLDCQEQLSVDSILISADGWVGLSVYCNNRCRACIAASLEVKKKMWAVMLMWRDWWNWLMKCWITRVWSTFHLEVECLWMRAIESDLTGLLISLYLSTMQDPQESHPLSFWNLAAPQAAAVRTKTQLLKRSSSFKQTPFFQFLWNFFTPFSGCFVLAFVCFPLSAILGRMPLWMQAIGSVWIDLLISLVYLRSTTQDPQESHLL